MFVEMLASSPQLAHRQNPHPHPRQHGSLPRRKPRTIPSISPPIIKVPTDSYHALHEDPILKFHNLLSDGTLMPDHHTFPSLFKACRKLSAIEEGRQLHSQAIKRGYHCDDFVQRSIIRMYAKCSAYEDALKVFVRCSGPDVISQNDLIVGFTKIGNLDAARQVFDGMIERNVVSWSVMIDGYAKNGLMEIAQDLFDSMPERNHFSWNSLIFGYLRCGRVEVAQKIFNCAIPEWGVVTWTAMISGYVRNCQFKEALDLFLDMQITGVVPNSITLVSVLPAVSELGALSQGRWIHAFADKMGMEIDSILGSALIDMYAKCSCIEDALTIFEKLKSKELSAWNSIISGLAAHGRGKDALRFFSRMREDYLMIPNDITFIGVLSACSHAGLVDEGLAVFDLFTVYYKLRPNIRHYGCMIDILSRAGLLKEALEFVEKMPFEPNLVVWKILLSACKIHKDIELADQICRKITELGPQDSGSYILMSNIYNEVGRCHDAGQVRREMNDLQVQKVAGCSWVEVDGAVHEFLMGRESFHAQRKEILRVLYEMERLIKLEGYDADYQN